MDIGMRRKNVLQTGISPKNENYDVKIQSQTQSSNSVILLKEWRLKVVVNKHLFFFPIE